MRGLAIAAACLLLMATNASAHGAAGPSDAFTRLLADRNDDCGGDGGAALGSCRGSHDLLALDVKETSDGLVFRFWMDKASTFPVTDTLTFTAGGTKTLSFKTSDDKSFQVGTGFLSISGPRGVNDGDRFTVDASASYASLGLKVGDKISGFKIESKAGSNLGDFMPGGCKTNLGSDCPAPSSDSTSYTKPDYTLRGAGYYVTLTGPTSPVAATSEGVTFQLAIKNAFTHDAQSFELKASAGSGATVEFHTGSNPSGGAYAATAQVDLAAKGTANVHVRIKATSAGSITLTATTEEGGKSTLQVPYTATQAASPQSNAEPAPAQPQGEPAKKSPAPGILLGGVVLLLAARRRGP